MKFAHRPGAHLVLKRAVVISSVGALSLIASIGLIAGPAGAVEISVQSTDRNLFVEREYRGIFFPPTYPQGYTLQLFAAFGPYAFVWPTPASQHHGDVATGPMALSLDYDDVDGVRAQAEQISQMGGGAIAASGRVRCVPDIMLDGVPTYIIFSRCKAESTLDVTFDIASPADYTLATTLSASYSTGTTLARIRLYDGGGALLHSRDPTGCVGDPPIPPEDPIHLACPSEEIITSGQLAAGTYRMELDILIDSATEDFYEDPYYGTTWPGWSEHGDVTYAFSLDLTDAPADVPVVHPAALFMISASLMAVGTRAAWR